MGASDDELWRQTAQLLRRRPNWVVQAVSTPGLPTHWCFGRGSSAEVSVRVEGGSINVYLGEEGHPVPLGGVDELVAWLNANRPGSLRAPRTRLIDKLKSRRLFSWD